MSGNSENPQHWSVHAEFTISHPGINDPENRPQTNTEQNDNNVRMTYTWSAPSERTPWSPPPSSVFSESAPSKSAAFQRGNLLFTSTPPIRGLATRLGVQDSGYGSDLLSPNNSGFRRPLQAYNRKCRSTCSIVLSTIHDEDRAQDDGTQCGRTQSLRCQTPNNGASRCDRRFYGCGDPWCHHFHYGDDVASGRFSPVAEQLGEDGRSTGTCATARFCDRSSRVSSLPPEDTMGKRDASVQTFEMVDKCTSPFLKMADLDDGRLGVKAKKKYGGLRRKTEPIYQRSQSPSSITPDSLDTNQKIHPRRLITRSPRIGRTPALSDDKTRDSATDSKCSDPSKKPRTVHIDVYCTGTEMESSSSESSENDTASASASASTPQTVFESEKVKITHRKANDKQLPFNTVANTDNHNSNKDKITAKETEDKGKSFEGINREKAESDYYDDGASTSYPSKLSSCSTIRDFSSSISSMPRSWTTQSMSSCTVPDDYDSIANTSWKDTFSDIDSLMQSRSSIAPTESLDFVPRRLLYEKNPSIDETPELPGGNMKLLATPSGENLKLVATPSGESLKLLATPSGESLQPSDSFEYADSEDRLRIKRMEELWKNKGKVLWKSPQSERRLLMQQKKIQEYMDRRSGGGKMAKSESKESESEGDSDDSEKGWTFLGNQRNERAVLEGVREKLVVEERKKSGEASLKLVETPKIGEKLGISCSPSLRERLNANPTLRAPFTINPGVYTEQRAVARKFGLIVNAFKKPGHHVGPAKNPDCSCDHCLRFFQNVGYRNRTRSMGDPPAFMRVGDGGRDFGYLQSESNSNRSVPSQLYTDF